MGLLDRFFKKTPRVDIEAIRAEAIAAGRKEAIAEVEKLLLRVSAPNAPLGQVPGIPQWNSPHGAYAFNNPITYATPQAPYRRPKSLVTLDMLRQLADTYDVLRSCINHLKREVRTVPFEVVAKKGVTSSEARIAAATALFQKDGPVGAPGQLYRHFESKYLEDGMVIGAYAIFHERSLGGQVLSSEAIDSSTIRPIIDGYGWSPTDPNEPAYEQWVYGVLAAKMTREDLSYDGLHAMSWNPYFSSPVEWLVRVVNAALYADAWNSSWLTDGNTPGDVYSLPENWSADDILKFTAAWDAMLSGDTAARQKTRFVPSGSRNVGNPSRKDQDFQAFELWLLRRTCSIMGVQPASIGYVGEQYKVSQDASMDQTTQFGAGDLLTLRKSVNDDILRRHGFDDLETVDVPNVTEDKGKTATTNGTLISTGQLTINEARKASGLEEVESGDVLLIPTNVQPLSKALAPTPEPVPDPLPNPQPEPKRIERKDSLSSALERYRAALLSHEEDARSATAEIWTRAEKAIQTDLAALLERIEEIRQVGGAATAGQLAQEVRYRALLLQIDEQLKSLAEDAAPVVAETQREGIDTALNSLEGIARAAAGPVPAGASLAWADLPTDAVEALIGFASDGSPLAKLFRDIGPDLSSAATQALVDGITGGESTQEIARNVDVVLNVGRARAENIARTETLRAMREATRQDFEANSDVLEGWVWHAALTERTCPACWAMHGSEHPATERLSGHPMCRCVMVPKVRSWNEMLGRDDIPDERPEVESGESAFRSLSTDQQRAILGPGLFDLWSRGELEFAQLAVTVSSPRWGESVRPATLTELSQRSEHLKLWQQKSLKRLKERRGADCPFESTFIDEAQAGRIRAGLADATTPEQIKAVFRRELSL